MAYLNADLTSAEGIQEVVQNESNWSHLSLKLPKCVGSVRECDTSALVLASQKQQWNKNLWCGMLN